jgi:hypothetical protein
MSSEIGVRNVIFPSMSLVASNVMSVDTSLSLYERDPFVENASLKFDYAGSMMKFVTKGSLSYNDKEVSTDMTFDATKDIEGKITLRTPISDKCYFPLDVLCGIKGHIG